MKSNNINEFIKNVNCEDVPNLGSIITLDNKGRLINSQFSKPSSSQTLLKLNSNEEIPDADDLPYSIISYGETPNNNNLPYNDHNYACCHYSRSIDNYDRKALDFILKQNSQPINRINFNNANNSIRISHFNSYNSSLSQNDSIFFGDKYKIQNQIAFNQQITHSSTPVVSNKSISSISQTNNIYYKDKHVPGTIVINSGSVNKLKGMNVIQLRRQTQESSNINETRIINIPMKKPTVMTNVIANNQSNIGNRELNNDKTDLLKSINLIPRCVCGFTHDDGGMIRCEICRTWQHIVCMYPDNKFPIYYKCERCEPRDVDIKRAVTTQTNILIKTGYNPSDFVVHQQYSEYDLNNDNLVNNKFTKSNNGTHFVIVKQDVKSVNRFVSESVSNAPTPNFVSSITKDAQTMPPGSPRTSKRKQDLISLKSVLTKSSTLNTGNINCKKELQTSTFPMETPSNAYNNSIPNQINKLLLEQNESLSNINEISEKLKIILRERIQFHTNMTIYQQHYLKQNNFIININMYEVVLFDFSCYAIKALVEFNATEIIMEYNGYVSLTEEYNNECDFRKIYNPYVMFYDKFDQLSLCIDSKLVENKARYIRRSCTPNAEVKHRLLQDGQIRFYIVPINRILKDSEITIAFDYDFMECRYPVECACNQLSCQLIYLKQGSMCQSLKPVHEEYCRDLNIYECANQNIGIENIRAPTTMTRPYKKRGRAAKVLNTSNRPIADNVPIYTPKPDIVRRNKRGRPPLNRSTGIQRADIVVQPPSDSSSSNHSLSDLDNGSDNESNHSLSNENIHPPISIHSNFRNFKRISSSHWSLKSNRKMSATVKQPKPVKDLLVPPKVGRPLKYKKVAPIKMEPVKYDSESEIQSDESEPKKLTKIIPKPPKHKRLDDIESDFENSEHGNLSRDDEGKYWLEEINNKILKQKAKESKKVQRKSKYKKKKLNLKNDYYLPVENNVTEKIIVEPKIEPQLEEEKIDNVEQNLLPVVVKSDTSVSKDKKESVQVIKKGVRGRKSQKTNTSYILSYKPSNIDDLKNDLMLISASLEEDVKRDNRHNNDSMKVESDEAYVHEVVIGESSDQIDESMFDCSEQIIEELVPKSLEYDNSAPANDSLEEPLNQSKSVTSSLNKSSDSAKEMTGKDNREERWVNTMWQRIIKNEVPGDKSRRRRSKSSAAEDSVASEENRNESYDIGSPKVGYSEINDDRDSSSNSKSNSTQKNKRKLKQSDTNYSESQISDVAKEVSTSSGLIDDHQSMEYDAQCGQIVHKEQHSNPMEKFSRENSTKLRTPDCVNDGLNLQNNIQQPAHTKKRWLSQALMEETLCDETPTPEVTMGNDIIEKLSSIDNVSKRSFLPPIITSTEDDDLSQMMSLNPKKRLLNQFSDIAPSIGNSPTTSNDEIRSRVSFQFSKSQTNIEQEQAKTKLSLSEYRKRRFNDKVTSEDSIVSIKHSKMTEEFHSGWLAMERIVPEVTEEELNDTERRVNNILASDIGNSARNTDPRVNNLSYMDTLNNLPMPCNLDPRLAKLHLPQSGSPVQEYWSSEVTKEVNVQSPSVSPQSNHSDEIMFRNGPRTPSECGDMGNTVVYQDHNPSMDHQSECSVHSFESQPSPTSDSHFEFERDIHSLIDYDKPFKEISTNCPNDWTTSTISIGRMAGIKNPDMLQEIDEFEDEYIPLPCNLPERTKEEIDTLLLTQKRDFQIREWQEVKQIEREKVKLDHKVRSMERRVGKLADGKGQGCADDRRRQIVSKTSVNPLGDYDVRNDEKTMKAFNVQLASINDRLIEQINSLKNSESPPVCSTDSRQVHRFLLLSSVPHNGPLITSSSSTEIRSTIV